ncbi:MAG: hypothetical protein F9K19_26360 [Rhizobiaceae bacterium]|nr:MAG: hypothetical protein F9K19_26360 [Rhizobiaceae bacterium]
MRVLNSFDGRIPASSGGILRTIPSNGSGSAGLRLVATVVFGLAALLSPLLPSLMNWHLSPALASSSVSDRERFTVVGTRLTLGDAVDCPTVKTDDGKVVSISYLPPSIAIGDRLSVTGFFAVTTHCRGKVLYAEQVVALGRD